MNISKLRLRSAAAYGISSDQEHCDRISVASVAGNSTGLKQIPKRFAMAKGIARCYRSYHTVAELSFSDSPTIAVKSISCLASSGCVSQLVMLTFIAILYELRIQLGC